MNRFTIRLIELCAIAVVGLTYAPTLAAAGPEPAGRDGSYAYIAKGGSMTMSGDTKDIDRVHKLHQGSAPLLWFREAGQEYIVRDPDTLAQVEAVWKPGRELDVAEAALDRQHEQLDAKREQLDARREQLETRRESLADRASELAERAADDSGSAAARAEAENQRRALQQQLQALADEQRGLEVPMKDLGAQMEVIQHQLDALHQKQKLAARKEELEVRATFRRAITAGTAKPAR